MSKDHKDKEEAHKRHMRKQFKMTRRRNTSEFQQLADKAKGVCLVCKLQSCVCDVKSEWVKKREI